MISRLSLASASGPLSAAAAAASCAQPALGGVGGCARARRCPSRSAVSSPSVVSSRSVSRTRGSARASTASVVSSVLSADRLSRVCSAAAGLEARQRSSAMADHQRTRRCTVLSVGSSTCLRTKAMTSSNSSR